MYLAIIKPANTAADRFVAETSHWSDQTTNSEMTKAAQPFIAANETADNKLLHVDWPDATTTDVKELVRAHGALSGDLASLGNQTLAASA